MLLGVHSFKLCSEIFTYARRVHCHVAAGVYSCIWMRLIRLLRPSHFLCFSVCLSVRFAHQQKRRRQQSTDREAQSEKLIYSWTADLVGTLSVSDPHAVNRFLSFLLSSRSSTRNVGNEEKKKTHVTTLLCPSENIKTHRFFRDHRVAFNLAKGRENVRIFSPADVNRTVFGARTLWRANVVRSRWSGYHTHTHILYIYGILYGRKQRGVAKVYLSRDARTRSRQSVSV